MKKLAALAMLATVAATAHAQSNVTLFGVIDIAARHVSNGDDSQKSLASGGINSSRLGVRGTEDLGGGLLASFWLEHGFNADTGSQSDSTRFWNRRSTVGLSNGLGEIRLGRDFTPSYTGYGDFDVFGDNGVAAGSKFFNKFGTTVDTSTRADNLVSYFTPGGLGGLYGQLAVAAGEGVSGKKYVGGRVGYKANGLNVSLAYGSTEVSPLAGAGGDDKYKTAVLGAYYDFGVVQLSGYYDQKKYADLKVATYNLGASVPLGLGSLRVGYTSANASGALNGVSIANNDAKQLAVGYVYTMSKRTAVYGTVARVSNDGAATYLVNASPATTGGKDSTGYEIGLRHSF
jgi:predicted porin